MAWGSFLLVGDMGQQLNLGEQAEEIGRLRRSIARRQSKDVDQDARIAALADENLNLKVGFATLVRMLVARGVLAEDEIANLIHTLDAASGLLPDRFDEAGGGGHDSGGDDAGGGGEMPLPVGGTGLAALASRAGDPGREREPAGQRTDPDASFKSSRNNGSGRRRLVNSRQRCLAPTTTPST